MCYLVGWSGRWQQLANKWNKSGSLHPIFDSSFIMSHGWYTTRDISWFCEQGHEGRKGWIELRQGIENEQRGRAVSTERENNRTRFVGFQETMTRQRRSVDVRVGLCRRRRRRRWKTLPRKRFRTLPRILSRTNERRYLALESSTISQDFPQALVFFNRPTILRNSRCYLPRRFYRGCFGYRGKISANLLTWRT